MQQTIISFLKKNFVVSKCTTNKFLSSKFYGSVNFTKKPQIQQFLYFNFVILLF